MRKNCFSEKKKFRPPPPPGNFFNFYFFSTCIFKKFIKNSNNIPSISKLYSTPPCNGARTCKVLRKYINAFSSYSAKTKRDGQTDGRGALQYLPSRAFGAAGDNKCCCDVVNLTYYKRPLGLTAPLSNCLCYTNDV